MERKRVYDYDDSAPLNLDVIETVKNGEIRYIVIDADTCEILDEANGNGYTSKEEALKSYDPSTRFAHLTEDERKMRTRVHQWCMKHDDLMFDMFDTEVEFFDKKMDMTEKDYEILFARHNLKIIDLPCTLNELLRFRL